MRFKTLEEWLAWQETLHPKAIDLGLERVGAVAERLKLTKPRYRVITVAGTNGKGSCVAMLEAIMAAAGYRVGAYTSPHVLRYNERIRLTREPVSDEMLCRAFETVDEARSDTSLSYFEFGTLAALDIFRRERVDVAILEVGLGGRLDAANVLDPDVALVTSIGVDHTEWLGNDREQIAREKVGILRPGKPAVCGDPLPPATVAAHAASLHAPLYQLGQDFDFQRQRRSWNWRSADGEWDELPLPALEGKVQLQNAAAVLMVLQLIADRTPVNRPAIEHGLRSATLPGRFQRLSGAVETVLDVAHNPDSARVLAELLQKHPIKGATHGVFSVLADKDLEGIVAPLASVIDTWYVGALDVARAQSVTVITEHIGREAPHAPLHACSSVAAAFERAMQQARPGDRVVVFGSFYTVAQVLALSV